MAQPERNFTHFTILERIVNSGLQLARFAGKRPYLIQVCAGVAGDGSVGRDSQAAFCISVEACSITGSSGIFLRKLAAAHHSGNIDAQAFHDLVQLTKNTRTLATDHLLLRLDMTIASAAAD